MSYQKKHHAIVGYVFMLPWIIGFLVLTAWPTFYTIYLSFNSVNMTVRGWEITWLGWDNFHMALFRDSYFTQQLFGFFLMEIAYVPIITVLAFILALLLNREIKGRAFFRAIFFLPVVIMSGPVMHQMAVVGGFRSFDMSAMRLLMMIDMLSYRVGNAILFIFAQFSTVLWFTGIPIILFLSGLQKIDAGIMEAAKIDSANAWQILWKITIPIVRPVFLVAIIMSIVQLANFTLNPVLPRIEDAIFQANSGLGGASAFAWLYSLILIALIAFAALLVRTPKDVVPEAIKIRERRWDEDRARAAQAQRAKRIAATSKRYATDVMNTNTAGGDDDGQK